MAKNNIYLVGVDGSEWAQRAANKAVSLAKETGAEVHLVSVIPWSGYTPLSMEQVSNYTIDRAEEEAHVQEKVLKPIVEANKADGVTIKTHFLWGHPVEEIHKAAKEMKAAMIFAGRRGRSRVADLLLGSVANSIAHKAGVPVVLVP